MADFLEKVRTALEGRYRVDREIGRGGAAIVFLAEERKHGRKVAIKVLRPEFAQSLGTERFLREIGISARLHHPNILALIDSGEVDGLLFSVSFYASEGSLAERLEREKQLPVDEALRITREVAEALSHAHAAGIVHRDIKPANVLFESGHAVVSDFGVARAISESGGDRLTETGLAIGTPAYMSPEQGAGDEEIGPRSDIYSLACMTYEMLAGSPPFTGATSQVILARKAVGTVPGLRAVRDTVPPAAEAAIMKALARVPADRFASATDYATALSRRGKPIRVGLRPSTAIASATIALAVIASSIWLATHRSGRDAGPLSATFAPLSSQPGVECWPSLSPDGEWVVYAGEGPDSRDVFLQSVSGQTRFNLTGDSPEDDTQPAFNSTGDSIAFRSSRQGGGIFVMGRTGEAVHRVTRSGFNPRWSPDGTRIVYADEGVALQPMNWERISQLWVADARTGEAIWINEGDAVQPSWSPNGRRIVFTRRMSDRSSMNIWSVAADGTDPVAITDDNRQDWSPAWSADGRYVFFTSDRGGSMNLWRIPVDEATGRPEGSPEPVTAPSPFVAHPSLSADGRRIAFCSKLETQNIQRASLDPRTGNISDPVWLTTGSRKWANPHLARDGRSLTMYSQDLPEGDLFVIPAEPGSQPRQLTSDTAVDRVPRWSPDGSTIAYFSNRSGPLQLWSIRADGSDNHQLTFGPQVGWGEWSRDGFRIAANPVDDSPVILFDPHQPWDGQAVESLPRPDSTIAWFRASSWSPDGTVIAGFVGPLSDDGIVTYSLRDRTYRRFTDFGQWPVWLPDGRNLLFVTGLHRFMLLDTRTLDTREVYATPFDVLGPPAISGDGRRIVYSRRVTEADIWLATIR